MRPIISLGRFVFPFAI